MAKHKQIQKYSVGGPSQRKEHPKQRVFYCVKILENPEFLDDLCVWYLSAQNMEIGISTLYNKLTDTKASYCCLCYKHEREKMCSVQDTVVFSVNFNDKDSKQDEVGIHYILQQILGNKVAYISEYDPICDSCTRSAISSYKFIAMCRENTESMTNSLDILTSNLEHAEKEDTQDHKSFFLYMNLKKSQYTHYYDTDQYKNSNEALYKFQTLFRPFRTVINFRGLTEYKCTKCPRMFVKSKNAHKHFNLTHKEQLDPCLVGEIKNDLVDSDEIDSSDMSSTSTVRDWNVLNSKDYVIVDNDEIDSAHDVGSTSLVPDWNANAPFNRDNLKRLNELSHEVIPSSDGGNKYKCRECGVLYANKANARRHFKKKHVPKSEIKNTDSIEVRRKKRVQNNKSKMKKSIPAYMTEFNYCKDKNKRLNELSHTTITDSDGNVKYKCKECKKVFVNRSSARRHYLTSHVVDMQIEVESEKEQIKTGLTYKNTGKNFSCIYCNKCHGNKYRLIEHLLKQHCAQNSDTNGDRFMNDISVLNRKIYKHIYTLVRDENGGDKYCCKICLKTFNSKVIFRDHFNFSHVYEGNPCICSQCGNKFKRKAELVKHEAHQHSNIACGVCKRGFKTKSTYNDHVCSKTIPWSIMKSDSPFICDICGKSYRTKRSVKDHIIDYHMNRTGSKKYLCPLCSKMLSSKYELKEHQLTHTIEKEKFSCDICGNVLGSKTALKCHTQIHSGETPYPCSYCDMKFLSKQRRSAHVRRRHTDVMGRCPYCGVAMKQVDIRRHKRQCFALAKQSKKNISDSTFICDICGKSYRSKNILRYHIRDYHMSSTGPKKYPCPLCSKMLCSKYSLKQHQLTHSGEKKNFSCDICGTVLSSKCALKCHTRIHTGETPYPCRYCDRKFRFASERLKHVKRHHMIVAIGPCPDCGVTMQQASIRQHMRKYCKAKLRGSTRHSSSQ